MLRFAYFRKENTVVVSQRRLEGEFDEGVKGAGKPQQLTAYEQAGRVAGAVKDSCCGAVIAFSPPLWRRSLRLV